MLIYATPEELAEYTGKVNPANVGSLLRSASLLVRQATRRATYLVGPTDMPRNPKLIEAFREAVCEQAGAWALLKIDPSVGVAGLTAGISSKSIGSVSISYSSDADIAAARAALASGDKLTTMAWSILQQAGLISSAVQTDPVVSIRRLIPAYEPTPDGTPIGPFVVGT